MRDNCSAPVSRRLFKAMVALCLLLGLSGINADEQPPAQTQNATASATVNTKKAARFAILAARLKGPFRWILVTLAAQQPHLRLLQS